MEEERRHEITKLQIDFMEIKKDIEFIKENVADNKKSRKEILEKLIFFIKAADDKYASRESFGLVQKIVFGMVGAICLSVLYAILSKVIN